MSERVWNDGQRDAIEARGSDILVSASAGSGKTAVLIERIIRHVTDTENPLDITDMLVVTFTDLATNQLKNKLSIALKKAINKAESKVARRHLRRQLAALPRASISTINSFCYNLVKSNFASLGLSANVRIADDAEDALILRDIMDSSIEDFYDRGGELGIDSFAELCNAYAELSDKGIADTFLDIFYKLYCRAEGLDILYNNALELEATVDGDPFDNKWGRVIKDRYDMHFSGTKKAYETYRDILEFDEGINKAYRNSFDDDSQWIERLDKAMGYFDLYEIVTAMPDKLMPIGTYKGKNKEDSAICKRARELYRSTHAFLKDYITNSSDAAKFFTAESARINRELHTFLTYFHNKAMEEKRRRGVVSFGDCEALAFKLLCDKGEPTRIARSYRERYREVYIDEYQDVNSLQDTIFRMVSRSNARFLVGDIKQSIYSFRGADPSLFGNYRSSFADYEMDKEVPEDIEGRRIFLSNNYRSSKNIIDFANAVSQGIFVDGKSNVGYLEGDRLVFSKVDAETDDDKPVTVAVVKQDEDKSGDSKYVCDEIEKLLARGVPAGDIAILLRTSTPAPKYTEELERRGIPYYFKSNNNFFENPEIALTLCWLNTIDNTRRDVYVCGILKSPIYNFTLDELTLIRNEFPRDTVYESVKAFTEARDFEKGKRFLSDIKELRAYSRGVSAAELFWVLLYDRMLMNAVTKNLSSNEAKLAKNNLLLFYDYAKGFENGEFKGLNNFLSYINEMISAKHTISGAAAFAGEGNAVQIMTIHKSKGLEFPYCFLCYNQSIRKYKDMYNNILYNDRLGVASRIPDRSGLGYYNSYIMDALKLVIEEDSTESEFLVLYVALTRGVNKMWVTCYATKPQEYVDERSNEEITRLYALSKRNYMAWILPSLKYAPTDSYELKYILDREDDEEIISAIVGEEESEMTVDEEALSRAVEFDYPAQKLGMIPAKVAVSRLYPDILDDDISLDMTAILRPKQPFFAAGGKTNRGAEIGNATHAFMQFCDFYKVDAEGVEAELERLTHRAFLSREAAELVDISVLKKFFASELYDTMRNAKRIFREQRFNINLDASEFTSEHTEALEGESILVQGVIDCFIYDASDEITLIDYKTDHIPHTMTREEGIAMLKERHSTQLEYYKRALESLTGDRVARMIIYSFALGEAIEL